MPKVTIYIQMNNLSTLTFGPVRDKMGFTFLKTSANTSQLVNSELSDKSDLRREEYD